MSKKLGRPSLIPWWTLIPLAIICIAIGMCLGGCASSELDYAKANAEPGFVPQPLRDVRIVVDATAQCALMGARIPVGNFANACSDPFGRVKPKTCTIILPLDAPRWMKDHEEGHCLYGRFH